MAFSDWFCYPNLMHEVVKMMQMERTLCIIYLLLRKKQKQNNKINYHWTSELKPHTLHSYQVSEGGESGLSTQGHTGCGQGVGWDKAELTSLF